MFQTRPIQKILLVGWELADWKLLHPLLDAGHLPHLERLIDRGVIANIGAASWRGVATGSPDDGPPAAALWNAFATAWRRCLVVRWPGSHPPIVFPAGGVFVSDEVNRRPTANETVNTSIEPESARSKVEALLVSAANLNPNELRAFVPALERLGEDDRTKMNWLAQAFADAISTQKIAATLLESERWDFAMIHYGALGAICRQFLGLSQEPNSVYGGVPAASLMVADQMLGRLLELAGEGTITCVCSAYGIFGNAVAVLAGPGIREDERLDEKDSLPASALDLAPTLCSLAGVLPSGPSPGRIWNVQAELKMTNDE